MFVPMVFMSVFRATITSFGAAGFWSCESTGELAPINATAKQTPPIDTAVFDIKIHLPRISLRVIRNFQGMAVSLGPTSLSTSEKLIGSLCGTNCRARFCNLFFVDFLRIVFAVSAVKLHWITFSFILAATQRLKYEGELGSSTVIARQDFQRPPDLFHQREHDCHPKTFGVRGIKSRWYSGPVV
jgi:hypothetical protein